MKKIIATASLLASILVGTSAFATEQWQSGTIKYIYQLGDGRFIVTFTTVGACAAGAYYVAPNMNGMTTDAAKQLLALTSLAAAMDKQFQIAFDDSTSYCYVNRGLVVMN